MLTKKSMVLTGIKNENCKAVLSFEYFNENLTGKLRLYNFSTEPQGILSLGITTHQGVIKAGLTKSSSMLYTFGLSTKEMPNDFSCAIINFVGGEPVPILFGSSSGVSNLQKSLNDVVMSLKGSNSAQEVEQILDDYGVDFETELKQEIEKEIDDNFEKFNQNDEKSAEFSQKSAIFAQNDEKTCTDSCASCPYKKYFFEHNETSNSSLNADILSKNKLSKIEDDKQEYQQESQQTPSFYSEIKKQIDTLFEENKAEEYLENAIPYSKWVKVEFETGGDYYVFGLIYDEQDELKYVCYGVPGIYSQNPPKQLSGYPVWFPLEKEKQDGFGYWLSYQDAETGESIKAIVE